MNNPNTDRYVPDEFDDDDMTLAGAEIKLPPPPPPKEPESTYKPDEFDDARTLAGADIKLPPAPPEAGAPGAAPAASERKIEASKTLTQNFIRLRRTDIASDGETYTKVSLIAVGSGPDNLVVVDSELVSEIHCRIEFENGAYTLAALDGSTVFLNGKKLAKTEILHKEDTIQLATKNGPAFSVDMLFPNRERAGADLPEALGFLAPVITPISNAVGIPPMGAVLALVLLLAMIGMCGCIFLAAIAKIAIG